MNRTEAITWLHAHDFPEMELTISIVQAGYTSFSLATPGVQWASPSPCVQPDPADNQAPGKLPQQPGDGAGTSEPASEP